MVNSNLYTIENDLLRAEISTRGAELCALLDKAHGFHALKHEPDSHWDSTAPVLFPICGRLWEQTTYVDGNKYRMGTHGFAADAVFTVSEHTSDRIALTLTDNETLLESAYPFRFRLTVEYVLEGNSLVTRVRTGNRNERPLPFSVGFHPGFALPIGEADSIEACYLDFPHAEETSIWQLSPRAYLTGKNDPYPLASGHLLPLRDDLLASIDSIFFIGSGDTVTLASNVSERRIRIDYAGFPYLGLWRPSDPKSHYICIEPWIGSPDVDGMCTNLLEKADMILLPAGAEHAVEYRVTVE